MVTPLRKLPGIDVRIDEMVLTNRKGWHIDKMVLTKRKGWHYTWIGWYWE